MEECSSQLSSLRDLLQSLEFVINVIKSQLIPVKRILYLGFIIDTVSMTLLLPDEKLGKILVPSIFSVFEIWCGFWNY